MRSFRSIALSCASLVGSMLSAQELVPNPSFEEITSCPTFASMLDTAAPWFNPTQGSPELFHACAGSGAYAGVPLNYSAGYQMPRTGSGFAGIYVFRADNSNMREYIEVPLLEPLEAGACYTFSMYVNAANDNELVCDGVGAYFSVGALEAPTWQVLPVVAHIEHPAGVLINDTLGWTEVSGTYIATGGEDHITIGNFRDDASTTWAMFNPGVWYANMAYLLVDDVSLVRNVVIDVDLGPDTLLCSGASLTLHADLPGATGVLWSDGNTDASRTITSAGTYTVTVNFGACSTSDEIVVDAAPAPLLELGADRALCPGLSLEITPLTNGAAFVWEDGSTSDPRTINAPGVYHASATNACGTVSDSIAVFPDDCPDGIYLPNAFSPNGDGINDNFAPVFDTRLWEVDYTVHDRWGLQLFSSPKGSQWTPDAIPVGIYAVRLNARSLTGSEAHRTLIAHVTLVR